MTGPFTMDQKIEILKVASQQGPLGIEETYKNLAALLSKDRCQQCRNSLKNVICDIQDPHASEKSDSPSCLTDFLDECYSNLQDVNGSKTAVIFLTRYSHGYFTFRNIEEDLNRYFTCRASELKPIRGNRSQLESLDPPDPDQEAP
jgi:hypothetical protein